MLRSVLDSSKECLALAKQLAHRPLRIMTNSLAIADVLSSSHATELHILGGIQRPGQLGLVGPTTIQQLKGLHASTVFLGSSGFHIEDGFSCPTIDEGAIRCAMSESSRRTIVLATEATWQGADFAPMIPINAAHEIISPPIPNEYYKALDSHNILIHTPR